jgi:amino acid transporter
MMPRCFNGEGVPHRRLLVMIGEFKRRFIGQPLVSGSLAPQHFPKRTALAIFASGALSSVVYSTEALLVVLATGTMLLGYGPLVAAGVALLLLLVAVSYRQVVLAYPQGGGGYAVARDHLGVAPSAIAAAALFAAYVLTVAVSASASAHALSSMFHALAPFRVELTLLLISVITLVNLRSARVSANLFALPTYLFLFCICTLLGLGLFHWLSGNIEPTLPTRGVARFSSPFTLLLLAHAFSMGCSALTGGETICDAVPAFHSPAPRNAARTLLTVALMLGIMMVGMTLLAYVYGVTSQERTSFETLSSRLARAVFGDSSPLYYAMQLSTTLILALAANTAYTDVPRLLSFLAADGLAAIDGLTRFKGMLLLGFASAALVFVYEAREQLLLPLFAIGMFLFLTLLQCAVARRSWHLRPAGWRAIVLCSVVGASVTGAVLVVLLAMRLTFDVGVMVALIPLAALALLSNRPRARC